MPIALQSDFECAVWDRFTTFFVASKAPPSPYVDIATVLEYRARWHYMRAQFRWSPVLKVALSKLLLFLDLPFVLGVF
jgi:hypothetical protein